MSIQKLRDSSEGMLSKILIGLIVVVFALFGFGSITTFLAPVPKVATVNGEDITQQEMELAVERTRRLLQARDQQLDEDQLRTQVLQNLVNRELLLQAAEDLDLYASESVIDEEIVGTEVFQIDGVFDPQQFQMVISGAGYSPLTYREEMKNDLRLQQMVAGIQASSFLSRDDALRASALAQQTRDIAFLRMSVDELMDEVSVSDEEIERYYNNNLDDFMTEETVDLAYLELKRSDLMEAVEVTDDALRDFYEETKARYAQNERRRVAHILVEISDEQDEAAARARINELYQRILDGESFEAVAEAESQDPGSAAQGGDLGFNAQGVFVDEFETVAWNLDRNQMSEPVQTEFGFHIIKLLDIEEARVPAFAEVRDKVEEEYREAEAEGVFVQMSGDLSEIAFEALDLQEPANALGLEIQRTGPVTRNASEGIAANPDVMDAAFSADVLIDGNNSQLIEITPNHHVVVRVAEHSPEEVLPLAEVREDVAAGLRRDKAEDLAAARAQEAVDLLEDGSITRFVADQFGLVWQVSGDTPRNGAAVDNEVVREAFRLPRPPEGQKSVGWAQLSNGDAAVITVTRVENRPVDQIEQEGLGGFQRILAQQQGGYEYAEFRDQLRESANISRVN